MQVSVLGPLRVSAEGQVIEVPGRRERTLLARLVADVGRMVPTSELIDALWGEDPPRTAAKSLQTVVLRVRNAIEPERGRAPQLLLTDGPGYRLALEPSAIDAERFLRKVALARESMAAGRPAAAARTLREALSMWHGPAYADFRASAFGQAEGRRLDEARLTAQEDLWAAEIDCGNSAAAAAELERFVGDHPHRERAWDLLMLAQYRLGRQAAALQTYERVRSALAEDLGVDPGAALRHRHQQVLTQDPDLRGGEPPNVPPAWLREPSAPMRGREGELATLVQAWNVAEAGGSSRVVVRGPAGAGATRLVQALVAHVIDRGGLVREADDAPAAGRSDPTLVVARGTEAEPAGPSTMVVQLCRQNEQVPPAAQVLDLGPLDRDHVAVMVSDLVDPESAPAALGYVLEQSGGWPGRIEAATINWAMQQAKHTVRAASVQASSSAAELAQARSALVESVQTLAESGGVGAHEDGVCPWRGLSAYAVEDARWFCGRERLTAELLARLAASPALAVVGPSGSGKSSVLRAGLLAGLRQDLLPGSGRWRQVVLHPGPHPMRALAAAAVRQPGVRVEDAISSLFRSEAADDQVVLAVDQLEEAWTACQDSGERTAFLDTLAALPTTDTAVRLVVAMRADFVGQLAEHRALAQILSDATVLVGQPTPQEIRRAIELPAERAGLELDVGLADALVADAGHEPGLLPLLSTSLTQLWHHRQGNRLTLSAYVSTGGLNGAIAHQAENAMDALPERAHAIARTVFLRLAGPGDGDYVTRRRVPVKELLHLGQPGMGEVVDALVRARLLTVSDGFVEVSHEALFREWPRLRGWLHDDSAGRAVQRRLALAAGEWEDEGRDPSLLWTGTRLAAGLEVAQARPDEITVVEREFLDAARERLDRERREADARAADALRRNKRLRVVAAGLATVMVLALIAGIAAWQAQQQSRRSQAQALQAQDRAEDAAVSATAGRLAANAVNEDHHDRALLLALEAVSRAPTPDTYGPLLTLLSRAPDLISQVRTEERFLRTAAASDGEVVYLGENSTTVWAVDARTAAERWRVSAPVQPLGLAAGDAGVLVSGPSNQGSGIALLDPGTGSEVWFVDEAALQSLLAVSERPVVGDRTYWTPDGLALVPTETHLVYLTPEGTLHRAVALPHKRWPDHFHLFPDGRVSMASDEEYGSIVIDPAHPEREPSLLPGHVWDSTAHGLLLLADDQNQVTDDVVYTVYSAETLEPVSDAMTVHASRQGRLSEDGKTLYAGEDNNLVEIEVATGTRVQTHVAHSGTVMDITFAADNEILWTAGRDGAAMAWDLTGTDGIMSVRNGVPPMPAGRVAADTGVGLAWRFEDHERSGRSSLHIVDLPRGEVLVADVPPPDTAEPFIWTAGVSNDGSTAAAVWATGPDPYIAPTPTTLVVYDLPSGRVRHEIGLVGPVVGLDLTADGSRAVVVVGEAAGDPEPLGEHAIVDLEAGSIGASQQADAVGRDPATTGMAALSPDDTRAAVGLVGGAVAIIDASTAERIVSAPLPVPREVPLTFAWSADGATVLVGTQSGRVHVLDATTLEPRVPARIVSPGFVIDLATSPSGDLAASLGTDGDLLLWDARTWQPLGRPVSDGTGWGFLGFHPTQPRVQNWSEQGHLITVVTDRQAWIEAACTAANRELTDLEREIHLREAAEAQGPTCAEFAR